MIPASTEDKVSLDGVIAKLKALDRTSQRAEEILAAAITLRDSSGRDRLRALRTMATTWHKARYEKVDGKWKDRTVSALANDIEAALCDAYMEWEQSRAGEAVWMEMAMEHRPVGHA
jgi:hypothetical protein